ncbi:MAG: ferritin family protein [Planctomycetes bacterium]|nr:ferritin family protein [Planctomycetota bacterium]
MTTDDVIRVMETAIATERQGMDLYAGAAERARDPLTKKMFQSFVHDERRHLSIIQGFIDQGALGDSGADPARRFTGEVRTIFSDAIDAGGIDASGDDVMALRTAAEFEREGAAFYREKAREMDDGPARALAERLAIEEENHLRILENTIEYLERPGDWFADDGRWSLQE